MSEAVKMAIKDYLARVPLVRPAVIHLLKLTRRNITISNPWTNDPLYLNSFYHKGYWFYGSDREFETMQFFQKCIARKSTVLEIGGHIGFISQYFSKLVGDEGKVVVFEPGHNNLPYIRRNLQKLGNVQIEEAAASDFIGESVFYEDNISGQNNSLLMDYKQAASVATSQSMALAKTERQVQVTTIDEYVQSHRLHVDFIKIDVEGNEYNTLLGARQTLKHVNSLMVEVTEHHEEVSELLRSLGFHLHDVEGNVLEHELRSGNIFAMRNRLSQSLRAPLPLSA